MKAIIITPILLLLALLLSAATILNQPEPEPELAPELQWLQQLVGQWDADSKMYVEPGEPPTEATGTDTVRAIGDHWIVAQMDTTVFGEPFSGIMSIGYDASKAHYVATWIDTMSGHLWVYKGTLNEARDTLTLETEGPSIEGGGKTARYRESLRITGKDTRTFTSTIETADGSWMTILSTEYRRTK